MQIDTDTFEKIRLLEHAIINNSSILMTNGDILCANCLDEHHQHIITCTMEKQEQNWCIQLGSTDNVRCNWCWNK